MYLINITINLNLLYHYNPLMAHDSFYNVNLTSPFVLSTHGSLLIL